MRILHTADWHLGRVFHGIHLTDDQSYLLEQTILLVKEEKIDVILISGDIFDRAVPPAEAVILLDEFLAEVSLDLKIPIILIAGNHDSADRLSFASRLLAHRNVYIVGRFDKNLAPIIIEDEYGPVYFCALPFVEPSIVKERLEEKSVQDYDTAMYFMANNMLEKIPRNARKVALAHAFAAGCMGSESERPISVGGAGTVSVNHFISFNYTALGHLHRPQKAVSDKIQYSGSLMKYSFDEAGHQKSLNIVELVSNGEINVKKVQLLPRHDVRCIEGHLKDILEEAEHADNKKDYLQVKLKDEGAILDPITKLREVYPNVLHIERPFITDNKILKSAGRDYRNKSIINLLKDFYEQVSDYKITAEHEKIIADLLEDVKEGGEY
jgi:exonuclease SbcD